MPLSSREEPLWDGTSRGLRRAVRIAERTTRLGGATGDTAPDPDDTDTGGDSAVDTGGDSAPVDTDTGGDSTVDTDTAVGPPDNDGDGYDETVDCDDADAAVNPGAEELPYNGVDDDCDKATPDDVRLVMIE